MQNDFRKLLQAPPTRIMLPFILASLGFTVLIFATRMPLLRWEISGIVTDFPPTYKVYIGEFWTANLGESWDDPYDPVIPVSPRPEEYGVFCYPDKLNVVVKRSSQDLALERLSLKIGDAVSLLYGWELIEIFLAGIFIWRLPFWDENYPVRDALIYSLIALCFCCILYVILQQSRPLFVPRYGALTDDCYGAISFTARISKIYYRLPLTLLASILLEFVALGLMVREFVTPGVRSEK